MASGGKKRKPPASGGEARREAKQPAAQRAEASNTGDPGVEDESGEPTPPLNRAARRLEAKRKSGRNAPTGVTPSSSSSVADAMRRRGVKGPRGSMKGTNTRRSG